MDDLDLTLEYWKILDIMFNLRTRRPSMVPRLRLSLPGPLQVSKLTPRLAVRGLPLPPVTSPWLQPSQSRAATPGGLDAWLEALGIEQGAIRVIQNWLRVAPDVDLGKGEVGGVVELDF